MEETFNPRIVLLSVNQRRSERGQFSVIIGNRKQLTSSSRCYNTVQRISAPPVFDVYRPTWANLNNQRGHNCKYKKTIQLQLESRYFQLFRIIIKYTKCVVQLERSCDKIWRSPKVTFPGIYNYQLFHLMFPPQFSFRMCDFHPVTLCAFLGSFTSSQSLVIRCVPLETLSLSNVFTFIPLQLLQLPANITFWTVVLDFFLKTHPAALRPSLGIIWLSPKISFGYTPNLWQWGYGLYPFPFPRKHTNTIPIITHTHSLKSHLQFVHFNPEPRSTYLLTFNW